MLDYLRKTFKSNSSLSNISVKKSNTYHNIRKLTKLSNLLRSCKRNERSQTSSRQNTLKRSCNFSFNRTSDRRCQLYRAEISNNVLLILIHQVVKNPLVKLSNSFKVISTSRLKRYNLIDQLIALMWEICDVLLPLILLLYISRVISDLQLDRVQTRRVFFLKSFESLLHQLLRFFLCWLVFKVELICLRVDDCLRDVRSKWFSDWISKLPALVDDHFHNDIKVCH